MDFILQSRHVFSTTTHSVHLHVHPHRDFGYVARDPVTKKHKCHVFRCDMPARAVAKALLETHQKSKPSSTPGQTAPGGRENEAPAQKRLGRSILHSRDFFFESIFL